MIKKFTCRVNCMKYPNGVAAGTDKKNQDFTSTDPPSTSDSSNSPATQPAPDRTQALSANAAAKANIAARKQAAAAARGRADPSDPRVAKPPGFFTSMNMEALTRPFFTGGSTPKRKKGGKKSKKYKRKTNKKQVLKKIKVSKKRIRRR